MSSAQFVQEPAAKKRSYVTNFTHWAKTTITNLPRPFAISAAPPPSSGQNLPTSMCASSSSEEEEEEEEAPPRHSFASSFAFDEPSPPCSFCMSPSRDPNMAQASACPNQSRWDDPTSCYPSSITPTSKSPWTCHMIIPPMHEDDDDEEEEEEEENETMDLSATTGTSSFSSSKNMNRLMGSLVREEGHIYSLAASGDLLYTGSDSKNIRVWKNQREYSGFKANSGLVKSIVISGEGGRIFTGHQDGKIRVWKVSSKNPTLYKRVATLPTLKAYIKSSMKPSSYVEVSKKNHRNAPWNRHYDAISSLSLTEDQSYLYSASWDQTVKVWKVSNFKCMESISAHDDAVNAVISAFDGLVFTGSADGSVKVWRREYQGKGTKHFFSQTLLKQECAVTALAVDPTGTIVYCGSSDGMVNYWQRNHLSLPSEHLRAHPLAVLCMATAGRLLFTGSADMNVGVWRRDEKNIHMFVSLLTGHSAPIKCLAVERDVKEESTKRNRRWILYSGSLDKSVKMWRVCDQAVAETPPPGLGMWWG